MKSKTGLLTLSAVFVFATSLFAADDAHMIVLEDPAGDIREDAGLDIVKLTIQSDGTNLNVTLELADDAAAFLKDNQAGGVVELHFDADNDPVTGGLTFWTDDPGFEYVVKINACIEYEGGHACGGALGGLPIKGYFTSFDVQRYEQGSKDSSSTHDDPFWKSPRGTIEGKTVTSSIAYAELGLSSGANVRVLARESDASFREGYFPAAELTLK